MRSPNGPGLLLDPQGRFTPGTQAVCIGLFGLFMGFANKVTWWLRGEADWTFDGVRYNLLFALNHALWTWMVFRALRRAPRRWWAVLPAAILGFILGRWLTDQRLMPLLGAEPNYPEGTGFAFFALDNVIYALLPIVAGGTLHLLEHALVQHHERTELAYRERLSELEMLRARMAPHFLFNTLNNLYGLSQRPGADLGDPLLDLAELMRYIAKHQDHQVPLRVELEHVRRYIALQRLRYDRPLNVRIDVPQDLQDVPVPSMMLLPLVENAFKHGDPCDPVLPLHVLVERTDDRLRITGSNRIGRAAQDEGPPTGNRDLQRRLFLLYGDRGSASFRSVEDRYTAIIELPLA
ncbi:MAG TPA: histidine kinase [Flavobacteriales bacterium]